MSSSTARSMSTSLVHSLARDKNMFYFCDKIGGTGKAGGAMRFSYAESMTDPSFYAPLARAAEEAGYHSMVIPDSICYPRHSASVYPFNPDGSREFLEDKPFLEPFSLIPALGAVTGTLRFVTFVLKLPVRDPVLTAKQATSTAVLTGGRLVLGAGISPWREDYEVLGVDWAS